MKDMSEIYGSLLVLKIFFVKFFKIIYEVYGDL